MHSFLEWWRGKPKSYKRETDAEAAFWGDFTARWVTTGLVPPWADARLAISQAIALGHRDRVLGGELENLARKRRFLRDALHRAASRARDQQIRVLELGCGAGFLSLEMGRQGADVLGVDISPGQISVARYFSDNGMRWPEALYPDYQGLPLRPEIYLPPRYEILDLSADQPEGAFDVIFAHDSIHHITNPEELTAKLSGLLRPGGCFLVIDHQETAAGARCFDALRETLADLCYQWLNDMSLPEIPRPEPYSQNVSFPYTLGREIMQGLADWLRRDGFPLARVSEATGESVPPPWPSGQSSLEGVSKTELGRRLYQTLQSLGYQEVTIETAFEPWRHELLSLRPEGMDWYTFYGLRALAEDKVLGKSPKSGEFFYLRAQNPC